MNIKTTATTLALTIAISMGSLPLTAHATPVDYRSSVNHSNAAFGIVVLALILGAVAMSGSDNEASDVPQTDETTEDRYYYYERQYQEPSYDSNPVQPINNFYSDCHSMMGC